MDLHCNGGKERSVFNNCIIKKIVLKYTYTLCFWQLLIKIIVFKHAAIYIQQW